MTALHKVVMALLGVVLIGSTAPSYAQFGGPMNGGPMGGGGPGGGPPGDRQDVRSPVMASGSHLVDDLQQQLDDLRLQLKLRPEQEASWQIYQERVGALMSDQLRPSRRVADAATGDAVHQIERKVDVVRNRLAALEDIADAARDLYGRLDSGQRAIADQSLPATVPALYSGLGDLGGNGPGGGAPPGKSDRRGPPPN
jgi:hypothetical protein